MKRKLILIVAVFLAFMVTAGTYAYTYTSTASISFEGVSQAGGQAATYEPAAWEPDWNAVLAGLSKGKKDDDYGKGKTRGEVPPGELFVVLTDRNFTGDLLVRVYLANTGDLAKAYGYLNMKLYLGCSIEAYEEPGYQLLSLDNGVASFNVEGDFSGSRTISVIGGSYRLNSNKPSNWEDGWTVVPEFYCEIIPK